MVKRGRPKKDVTRNNKVVVRLTDSEYAALKLLSDRTRKPASDILRLGLELVCSCLSGVFMSIDMDLTRIRKDT